MAVGYFTKSNLVTAPHYELRLMAPESRITLRYIGPSVDDGTLPIDDVVSALQGFAGAYSKVSHLRESEVEHQLRVSAIKPGSFEVVILAWLVLNQAPTAIQGLELVSTATNWVIEKIFSAIKAKKHIKNEPYQISVQGDHNVVVLNASGAELVVPVEMVALLRDKVLDADLNKIVSPLEEHRIDLAEISAETENGELLSESVTSEEREYFRPSSTTTTQETQIFGKFISLNKDRHGGTFELANGNHIPYKYIGGDPDNFPIQFARKGAIRVVCVATLDESLEPTRIEIKKVTNLQGELLLPPSAPEDFKL